MLLLSLTLPDGLDLLYFRNSYTATNLYSLLYTLIRFAHQCADLGKV